MATHGNEAQKKVAAPEGPDNPVGVGIVRWFFYPQVETCGYSRLAPDGATRRHQRNRPHRVMTVCVGLRGKYAKRYHAGTNLVLLDPDIRKAFRSERAVNDALRLVIELRKVGSYKQA